MEILTNYGTQVWVILTALAPWLFLGAGLASLLKWVLPEGFVGRHIGPPGLGSILKTVVLGIPLPLCSCGTVPAAIGLKKEGASRGAVVGFLISTPQTGADSLLVTASFLGWPLALFKVVAAFVTGVAGGAIVEAFGRSPQAAPEGSPAGATCVLSEAPGASRWRGLLRYALDELIGGIYPSLVAGILIAALISLAIPPQAVSRIPALQGVWGMLAMLAIASPLYVCSTGSVAIAASLIQSGLPLGSALVFLMSGPATNTATVAAIWRAFGRRVTFLYLASVVLGSLTFGLIFQALFPGLPLPATMHHHHGALAWQTFLNGAAAVVLVGLIVRWSWLDARAWLRQRLAARRPGADEMTLQVDGMTCANCAAHIRRDLEQVPGVTRAEVNLETGLVRLQGRGLSRERLTQAVCQAGYAVRGVPCA